MSTCSTVLRLSLLPLALRFSSGTFSYPNLSIKSFIASARFFLYFQVIMVTRFIQKSRYSQIRHYKGHFKILRACRSDIIVDIKKPDVNLVWTHFSFGQLAQINNVFCFESFGARTFSVAFELRKKRHQLQNVCSYRFFFLPSFLFFAHNTHSLGLKQKRTSSGKETEQLSNLRWRIIIFSVFDIDKELILLWDARK